MFHGKGELRLLISCPEEREIILDYPGGPTKSQGSCYVEEGGRRGSQRGHVIMHQSDLNDGFEDGGDHKPRNAVGL